MNHGCRKQATGADAIPCRGCRIVWYCGRACYLAYGRRHRGRDWCRAPAEELMRRARLAKAAGRYEAEVRLIRRAAEKHFWHAQFALGTMYLAGRREAGVGKHPARALEWLSAAARQGHKLAQYRVGVMHEAGLGGLAADEAKALRWYRRAAAQGVKEAQAKVDRAAAAARELLSLIHI